MADEELTELPLVTDLLDGDSFYIVQGGNSRRILASLLKQKLGGGGSGGLWDAIVNTPADLATYNGQNPGYKVLVRDAGNERSAIYTKIALGWSDPIFITGDNVEMSRNATHLLWRNTGDSEWQNLVPLADITGDITPELEALRVQVQNNKNATDTNAAAALASQNLAAKLANAPYGEDIPVGSEILKSARHWAKVAEQVAGGGVISINGMAGELVLNLNSLRATTSYPVIDLQFTSADAIIDEWFTRASQATYFDATGRMRVAANNELRIDHDPVTGECLGALIEEPRTNLIPGAVSPGGANGDWSLTGIRVNLNAALAPDGTMRATAIQETATTGNHQLICNVRGQTEADRNFYNSVFVKKYPGSLRKYAYVWCGSFANHAVRSNATIDLETGEIVNYGGAGSGWAVAREYAGDGWWRVFLKGKGTATPGTVQLVVSMNNSADANASYEGDDVSQMLVWGYQQENGLYPTSFIPTEAAAATRAGDRLDVPFTASEFNGSSFTVFSDARTYRPKSAYAGTSDRAAVWSFVGPADDAGTSFITHAMVFYTDSSLTRMVRTNSVSYPSGVVAPIPDTPAYQKLAIGFDGTNVRSSVDGASVISAANSVFPIASLNKLQVGQEGVATNLSRNLKGHIRQLAVYSGMLSDDELRRLSA